MHSPAATQKLTAPPPFPKGAAPMATHPPKPHPDDYETRGRLPISFLKTDGSVETYVPKRDLQTNRGRQGLHRKTALPGLLPIPHGGEAVARALECRQELSIVGGATADDTRGALTLLQSEGKVELRHGAGRPVRAYSRELRIPERATGAELAWGLGAIELHDALPPIYIAKLTNAQAEMETFAQHLTIAAFGYAWQHGANEKDTTLQSEKDRSGYAHPLRLGVEAGMALREELGFEAVRKELLKPDAPARYSLRELVRGLLQRVDTPIRVERTGGTAGFLTPGEDGTLRLLLPRLSRLTVAIIAAKAIGSRIFLPLSTDLRPWSGVHTKGWESNPLRLILDGHDWWADGFAYSYLHPHQPVED